MGVRASCAVTPALPAAVLWDMDGTLIDTEPLWIAAETNLVARHGGTWTAADSVALVGSDLLEAAGYIRERGGIDMPAAAIRDHLMGEVLRGIRESITWQPGARELLFALRDEGVPCALVTMSHRVLADAVIDVLPVGTFDAVVTGDEVGKGKPDPEPYLTAAARLGVAVQECVVIEDSGRGVEAGLNAGARVLGVPNVVPLTHRDGLTISDSLADFAPADLQALWNGDGQRAESVRK